MVVLIRGVARRPSLEPLAEPQYIPGKDTHRAGRTTGVPRPPTLPPLLNLTTPSATAPGSARRLRNIKRRRRARPRGTGRLTPTLAPPARNNLLPSRHDLWPRRRIRAQLPVDISSQPGVRTRVRPRKVHTRRHRPARASLDPYLEARHVQLSWKRMQRYDLRSEQIIPRRKGRRNRNVEAPAACVQVLGAPVVVVADARVGSRPGVLVDLKPRS